MPKSLQRNQDSKIPECSGLKMIVVSTILSLRQSFNIKRPPYSKVNLLAAINVSHVMDSFIVTGLFSWLLGFAHGGEMILLSTLVAILALGGAGLAGLMGLVTTFCACGAIFGLSF